LFSKANIPAAESGQVGVCSTSTARSETVMGMGIRQGDAGNSRVARSTCKHHAICVIMVKYSASFTSCNEAGVAEAAKGEAAPFP
jgi:hypothetical protein